MYTFKYSPSHQLFNYIVSRFSHIQNALLPEHTRNLVFWLQEKTFFFELKKFTYI